MQTTLQGWIDNGTVQDADQNRFYVVFSQPNVVVQMADGTTSVSTFYGYHSSFAGHDSSGNGVNVRYAVVAYPGGAANNGSMSWLPIPSQLNQVASHEIAEGATDPDGSAWFEDGTGSEIGEAGVTANQTVYVNGYPVQRIADQNDQPMTPSDATAYRPVTFAVENVVVWNRTSFWKTTKLFENSSDGWQPVTYSDGTPVLGIRSISDQGIDNFGHAMIDVTLNDNTAYEVADGYQPALLGYGIKDAKAGQGVSYVLFNNGNMYEYTDATSSWSFLDSGVSAIDAGTDRLGVNMVAELYQGQVWTRSDSSGWQQIPYHLYSVGQISAGRQGVLGFVDAAGRAYLWSQDSGQLTYEIDGVNRITTGYDQNGGLVVDLLYSNGNVYDWRATTGRWIQLAQSTHALSKARAGVVDVLANTSDGWEIGAGFSYTYLGNAIQGVA